MRDVRIISIIPLLLLLCSPVAKAQENASGSQAVHEFCDAGVLNPSSTEVWAMMKYGESFSSNLNQGTLSLDIPFYTYSDEDFTIPISLSYHADGYRPNIQSGPEGLGWSLSASGAITREVRGIPDEEGWTSTDMYSFSHRNTGYRIMNPKQVTVHGWASLYDTTYVATLVPGVSHSIDDEYFEDFCYIGKAGCEYLPIWSWDDSTNFSGGSNHIVPSYESSPDIFHFSFLGRSGSFVLMPAGEVRVFGTDDSPLNYTVTATLSRSGITAFTIRTEDNMTYEFGPAGIERSESYNMNGTTENLSLSSTWRLTAIEAPNGRRVVFEYNEGCLSTTMTPTVIMDNYYTTDRSGDPSLPEDHDYITDRSFSQNVQTVSLVHSLLLTKILVPGRAEILFSYGFKVPESGADNAKKLERIEVRSLRDGTTIKEATLSYRPSGSNSGAYPSSGTGVTFLSSITVPGEGVYSMHYIDEDSAFPSLGTYSIDWMGFFNGRTNPTTADNFCPTLTILRRGLRTWDLNMRLPDHGSAEMGMLSSISYPTGGSSTFQYGPNRYSEDLAHPRNIVSDETGYGVRIERIENRDADGLVKDIRTYDYVLEDGRSSGKQLWRPLLYTKYKAEVTFGFKEINRETLSSSDAFPYSRGAFMEYSRVLEKRTGPFENGEMSITEYLYRSFADPACKDETYGWMTTYGFDNLPTAGWMYNTSEEPPLNSILRTELTTYLQSRIGGQLISRTEYSNDLYHPVRKTAYVYGTYMPREDFITSDVCFGALGQYRLSMQEWWRQGTTVTEYDTEGNSIVSRYNSSTLDQDYRIASTTSVGSAGDTLVNYYSYLPECPSLITEMTVIDRDGTDSGVVVEGVRRTYVQSEDHPLLFLPRSISVADCGGQYYSSNLLYRLESRCNLYSDNGLPLEITDKSGMKTSLVWEYGGQYLAMKIEGISYDSLTDYVPGVVAGYVAGSLPAATDAAVRAIPGVLVTTWSHAPLVGITAVKDPSGRTVHYDYDSYGRLTGIRNDDGEMLSSYEYHILTDNNAQ